MGGVRVIASSRHIAEARRIIARMREGEFANEAELSGDWMIDHTPGRIGELDEAEVHGVMGHAKKAGVIVVVLFFVVFPLAGCVMLALGY